MNRRKIGNLLLTIILMNDKKESLSFLEDIFNDKVSSLSYRDVKMFYTSTHNIYIMEGDRLITKIDLSPIEKCQLFITECLAKIKKFADISVEQIKIADI